MKLLVGENSQVGETTCPQLVQIHIDPVRVQLVCNDLLLGPEQFLTEHATLRGARVHFLWARIPIATATDYLHEGRPGHEPNQNVQPGFEVAKEVHPRPNGVEVADHRSQEERFHGPEILMILAAAFRPVRIYYLDY